MIGCEALFRSSEKNHELFSRKTEKLKELLTSFILSRALCKDVLAGEIDSVAMKIMTLEKLRPELLLAHLMRNKLQVLLLNGRVCSEDRFDGFWCDVVLDSITAVSLRTNISLQSTEQMNARRSIRVLLYK